MRRYVASDETMETDHPDNEQGAHIESRMSSSGWVGGQDWDGPHRVVGRLVLGHTVP